jgi:hypothetical protein
MHHRHTATIVSLLVAPLAVACSSSAPANNDGAIDAGDEAATMAVPGTGAPRGPVDVPITIRETAVNGTMRFSIPIAIGGAAPMDVFFDTGSSGLRILDGAIPDSAYAMITDTPVTYSYHSGLELTGVVAYANVVMGSIETPMPVPVMLIRQVGCTAAVPNCSAKGQTPATYTLFGPFKAIFGAGMRHHERRDW